MRQILLDTETTGIDPRDGHRIIEIGCIELMHRRATGKSFHRYLNPERDIDAGAQAVHGLSRARLAREPRFADIAADLLAFLGDAELVIHNAPFDIGFLDAEFARLVAGSPDAPVRLAERCTVVDTLALARKLHPGQKNNLDALCKRYSVDNSGRDLHGALLDARLLADVYLGMTGGQDTLALEHSTRTTGGGASAVADELAETRLELLVQPASEEERAAHEQLLELIQKQSGGRCVWRTQ
jgi:DNA polymerase-3 subunit epsilon